jgi:deazaflavin-dependent oxidoreductase (nitroreductase family)
MARPTDNPALKDATIKVVNFVHRSLFDLTDGRVAGRIGPMPVVKLTTVGRRTGQRRTTMLTSPVQDGEDVVLVASWGGDDRHPTWYLNLRDNPDVEITMSGRRRHMRARTADAEEKAALWPRIVQAYSGYDGYQRRTQRDIPVVILEPAT